MGAGLGTGVAPVKHFLICNAMLGLVACGGEAGAPVPAPDPPVFNGVTARLPPDNVLSAGILVRASDADSVRIRYQVTDSAPATEVVAQAQPVAGDSAAFLLLGLLPGSRYTATALAFGAGGTVTANPVEFTTGTLPADLPAYVASGTDPAPGYVVFAAGAYGIVIDNSGRVVWYHHFPNGIGLNFQALQNGRYATQPRTADPADIEPWAEVAPSGEVTSTFGCANGLQPRFHDAISDLAGGHWIMCDDVRTMDLTAIGGQATARVTGTVFQHVDATGAALFQWSAFDHFALTDLPAADRTGPTVNFTHGNAIALDTDGNLLASFRSLSEITKISATTGDVLWRLGGLANQFTFSGSANPPFIGQHGLRVTSSGLLLLDNRGEPGASRAERYRLDEVAMTATQVESFSSAPSSVGMLGGSVQQLENGHVLVSLGNGQKVEEYDAAGNVVWRLSGGTGYIFRAQRIGSLYAPGVGNPR
jgi:hypothetical protein